jgi:hypothetical protein
MLCAVLVLPLLSVRANEPLHTQVDALIAAKAQGKPISPAADDAEFLRRVWLDFDGGIPTSGEVRQFIADASPTKRTELIDRLIAAPRFAGRMANAFDVMLMERRGTDKDWQAWLTDCFRSNKSWDQMVREMLAPDFADEKERAAGWFMTRRLEKVGQQDTDYPGLTRDVGRMFMGIDLQCCQCHKHLTVDDYKQKDFSGLLTVYQNLKLQPKDASHKSAWLSEGLMTTRYEFASVLNGKKDQTGPRVPFEEEVTVPEAKGDEGWLVKPDRKAKEMGVPRFSPLKEIAQRLPHPDNPRFAKNIANRVWFLLMGRGLVEPLDLQHTANPPTHPELLDLLAQQLVAHQFDLHWLIHELALTQMYARSSIPAAPVEQTNDALYLTAMERHLTAEQQLRSFLIATGELDQVSKTKKGDAGHDAAKYTLADFEKAFATALENPAKEPELHANPTLRSALFLRNGDQVQWALRPREANLIDRVLKLPDACAMSDELYLSILTRLPDRDEAAAFADWLQKHESDKAQAVGDMAWALLSSTEWFVNH